MSPLKGFDEYMQEHAGRDAFEELGVGNPGVWHLHGVRVIQAKLAEHSAYEVTLQPEAAKVPEATQAEGQEEPPLILKKTQIKFFHPVEQAEAVEQRVKVDTGIRARGLEPIENFKRRHFVKNKTLHVLRHERTVVECVMLEGEVLRGLIGDFTRYTIMLLMKGGVPLTVLRHAILELRDKQGRGQLKTTQDQRRDWKKSDLYHASA